MEQPTTTTPTNSARNCGRTRSGDQHTSAAHGRHCPLYHCTRKHTEHCSSVWSPNPKKDILRNEKVQRRVTKMIPSISTLNYEERLKRTRPITLENRRLRADLLEVCKIMPYFVKVDPATNFSMSDIRYRGHSRANINQYGDE